MSFGFTKPGDEPPRPYWLDGVPLCWHRCPHYGGYLDGAIVCNATSEKLDQPHCKPVIRRLVQLAQLSATVANAGGDLSGIPTMIWYNVIGEPPTPIADAWQRMAQTCEQVTGTGDGTPTPALSR